MAESRYATMVRVTFPLQWVDPTLRTSVDATPSAQATDDGLAIGGTPATVKAGKLHPNNNVTGTIGSKYMRYMQNNDSCVEYVKCGDDGGNTGWALVMNDADNLAPVRHMVFGISDDTVADNAATKYGVCLEDSIPWRGAVTCVTIPPDADMILDIKMGIWNGSSYDWTSIFDASHLPTFPQNNAQNSILFTQSDMAADTDNLAGIVKIPTGALLRLDVTQSGGAVDVLVDLKLMPYEKDLVVGPGGIG